MNTYQQIGYTKKTHGTKGALRVQIEDQYLEDFSLSEVLFLEINGKKVPYFVEDRAIIGDLLVYFEEIETREQASSLTGKTIFLAEKDILQVEERQFEISEDLEYAFLKGYQISLEDNKVLGKIDEVIEFPQQEMAFLQYEGKEIMIPLNDHFIHSIDKEKKILIVQLPEGLLDI